MSEFTKETVVTKGGNSQSVVDTQEQPEASKSQTIEYLIFFFFGALEVLLIFRLFLKVTGASITSGFVDLIYSLSGIFVLPFEGIFRKATTEGIETTSVFEPSVIVAIIVYAVVAIGIVKLVRVLSGKQQVE